MIWGVVWENKFSKSVAIYRNCPATSVVSTFYWAVHSTHIPVKAAIFPRGMVPTELFVALQAITLEVTHDHNLY